jgi:outer membrane protein OmpA-like peptidoglycan-associated protein
VKRIFVISLFLTVSCFVPRDLRSQSASDGKGIVAISYFVNAGPTKVDLVSTGMVSNATGEAKVDAREGVTMIDAKVQNLPRPGQIATEFLTYVLWAVSPDGRTINIGEILINDKGSGRLKASTQLQTFSLFVTSEPYHSVRQPSEIVVLKNEPTKKTMGNQVAVDQYRLMKRSQYERQGNPLDLSVDVKNVPLQMYEARNAVEIAKSRGAEKYAPEIYGKAQNSLKAAEDLLQQKADKKEVISMARQTMQFSEDSRALAADRQEQERIAMERQLAADTARNEAEAKAAQEAAALRAEADALRRDLLKQLGFVLETRDTPRGLVVNMADVLFDTGKYDLRRDARDKLAKLSGILALHPGLQVDIEGHTDTTGSAETNRILSEQRAKSVATFLSEQGVPAESINARGLGAAHPVADNKTTKGRQQNRRVEIIVSGEAIGRTIERPPDGARISN